MNTMAFLFVFLFGLAAVVGLGLSAFWGIVAKKRIQVIEHKWYHDRYAIVAIGFTFVSGGQAIIDVFRLIGNVEFGLSRIIQSWTGVGILSGMLLLCAGLFAMVWLADLEIHPPRWTWLRRTVTFTVCWFVVSWFLHTIIPIYE